MKPENRKRLRQELKAVPDHALYEIAKAVIFELERRGAKYIDRAAPRGAQENEAYYRLNKGLQPDS